MPMKSDDSRAARRAAARAARRIAVAMTPEEDAALTAAARADRDNPPITDEEFAEARPLADAVGRKTATAIVAATEALGRRRRGQRGPGRRPAKVRITVRIDADLAEAYAAGEPGISERVNAALRKAAGRSDARPRKTSAPASGAR